MGEETSHRHIFPESSRSVEILYTTCASGKSWCIFKDFSELHHLKFAEKHWPYFVENKTKQNT